MKLLKTTFLLVIVAAMAVSCNPARRLTNSRPESAGRSAYPGTENPSAESKRVYKGGGRGETNVRAMGNIETTTRLQFKYAVLTNAPVEELANLNLLNYIEDWYGVPYRYGGSAKSGVDCSAFSLGLMSFAFGVSIPRTVKEQFEQTTRIDRNSLQQGDLVFFNTNGTVSHVGIYVANNKFVHASTSHGVIISDLGEDYYLKRYIGAGRTK